MCYAFTCFIFIFFLIFNEKANDPTPLIRGKTPVTLNPTSPLRVIPRHDTSSVPNSPVPLVDGPSGSNITPQGGIREWPAVARPRPEKNGVPIGTETVQSQEDQEIVEIVRQGELQNKGRQSSSRLCDSVLQVRIPKTKKNPPLFFIFMGLGISITT